MRLVDHLYSPKTDKLSHNQFVYSIENMIRNRLKQLLAAVITKLKVKSATKFSAHAIESQLAKLSTEDPSGAEWFGPTSEGHRVRVLSADGVANLASPEELVNYLLDLMEIRFILDNNLVETLKNISEAQVPKLIGYCADTLRIYGFYDATQLENYVDVITASEIVKSELSQYKVSDAAIEEAILLFRSAINVEFLAPFLELLHSKVGVSHRLLNGRNICISPSGACLIKQFGFGKKLDPEAIESKVVLQTNGTYVDISSVDALSILYWMDSELSLPKAWESRILDEICNMNTSGTRSLRTLFLDSNSRFGQLKDYNSGFMESLPPPLRRTFNTWNDVLLFFTNMIFNVADENLI
eukprot:TRINITY_DN443_c0_g1_i2.p1 TRINITY_DN443_c0_g1~~TRINITY_DN443_c0_g1_i2.p1  ORF type:complete len:355 (+),score=68.93 TRINITY_DN443_c0_g1_i2:415-1479(+)